MQLQGGAWASCGKRDGVCLKLHPAVAQAGECKRCAKLSSLGCCFEVEHTMLGAPAILQSLQLKFL
jgi:hypothetical protein